MQTTALLHEMNVISKEFQFSPVESPIHVWLFATPWTAARLASPSITNSWSLLKLMSTESVMPSNHLILCRSLLLLPSIFPSIRIFSFFFFFFFCWRLITLQYCSGFYHILTWISHGYTCIPHPDPPSYLPLHLIPLGLPSVPGLSTCLMHPTWAGDLFHPRWYTCFDAVLLKHPTLAFSTEFKSLFYTSVSLFLFCI